MPFFNRLLIGNSLKPDVPILRAIKINKNITDWEEKYNIKDGDL